MFLICSASRICSFCLLFWCSKIVVFSVILFRNSVVGHEFFLKCCAMELVSKSCIVCLLDRVVEVKQNLHIYIYIYIYIYVCVCVEKNWKAKWYKSDEFIGKDSWYCQQKSRDGFSKKKERWSCDLSLCTFSSLCFYVSLNIYRWSINICFILLQSWWRYIKAETF